MLEKTELDRVLFLISWWLAAIESHNAIGFFDINRVAEGVALKLLNEIYDYQLENLNYETTNYPGIDLGDSVNKIGFQVTSRKDSNKIKESLKKFSKGPNRIYPNGIRFLILSRQSKPQSKKGNYQDYYSNFEPSEHILNADDLAKSIQRIYDSDINKFYRIKNILEIEIAGNAMERALHGETTSKPWIRELGSWDFTPFLEERRNYFVGRQWLFEEINNWLKNRHERSMLITGEPGIGKSAVAAELIHRNPGDQVLAYHCCQSDTPATLEPAIFIRSLAAMIAERLADYAEMLESPHIIELLSPGNCKKDPLSAFELGILSPLSKITMPEGVTRYIIIDSLDESLLLKETVSPHTLLDILVSRIERLPSWLRILATTRKERTVLDQFRGLRAWEIDAQDDRNLEDISLYIDLRLNGPSLAQKITRIPKSKQEIKSILQEKSAGNFLYLQQTFQGIERDLLTFENLDELPSGLYGLYLIFFKRYFSDKDSFSAVRRVLEVLTACQVPLTEEQLTRATGIGSDELYGCLRHLSPFLSIRNDRYAIFHRSFIDWLTAVDRRGAQYYVNPIKGHRFLSDICMEEFRAEQKKRSEYTLKYIAVHLITAKQWDNLEQVFRCANFINIKGAMGAIYDLLDDYATALDVDDLHTYSEELYSMISHLSRALDKESALINQWYSSGNRQSNPYFPVQQIYNYLIGNGVMTPSEAGFLLPEHEERMLSLGKSVANLGLSCSRRLSGHTEDVGYIVVSRDGRSVISVAFGAEIYLWDMQTGRLRREIEFRDKDGGILYPSFLQISSDNNFLYGATWDGIVCKVSLSPHTFSPPLILAQERVIYALAVSSKDETIAYAAGTEEVTIIESGGTISVSGNSSFFVVIKNIEQGYERRLSSHTGPIVDVEFSPDGHFLATASYDGTVLLWDLREPDVPSKIVLKHRPYSSHSVTRHLSFSPQGDRLACCGEEFFEIVDCFGNQKPQRFDQKEYSLQFEGIAFSPDGNLIATSRSSESMQIWSVSDKKLAAEFLEPLGESCNVCFSVDGRHVMVGSSQGEVLIYDVPSGQVTPLLDSSSFQIEGVAISPNFLQTLVGTAGGRITLWDNQSFVCTHMLVDVDDEGQGHVPLVQFSPDGKHAAANSEHGNFFLWELEESAIRRIDDRSINTVHVSEFSPNGVLLNFGPEDENFGSGSRTKSQLLNLEDMKWRGDIVDGYFFTPDGRNLVVLEDCDTHNALSLYSLEAQQTHTVYKTDDKSTYFKCISPDALRAVMGRENEIIMVDLQSGKETWKLPVSLYDRREILFSPDGKFLAMGGESGKLVLIDGVSGIIVAHSFLSARIMAIRFYPDGSGLCAIDDGGTTGRPGIFCYDMLNFNSEPPIITPWLDNTLQASCPFCSRSDNSPSSHYKSVNYSRWPFVFHRYPLNSLGNLVTCPNSGRQIQLNKTTLLSKPSWLR